MLFTALVRPVAALAALVSAWGCGRDSGTGETVPPPTGLDQEVIAPASCEEGPVPGEAPLRLLTRSAYENSISSILGDTSQPARSFPGENLMLGFNNNAEAHQATPLLVSEMLEAAEGIAARAVQTRLDQVAPCPSGAFNQCGSDFIANIGGQLFRRPLAADETQVFLKLYERSLLRGYSEAVARVLEAMLQSPQFLYRVENVRPKGAESGAVLLGGYELATRLSYFLTDSTPDDALLTAAANDELSTRAEVEGQARRLLGSPYARGMVAGFHSQWLDAKKLSRLVREDSAVMVPENLGENLQGSLAAFMDSVFWESGNVEQLFTSDAIFVNNALAGLYGASAATSAFEKVNVPGQRFGLLTQPGLMAALAHPNQTAPVFRGIFVREHLLCQSVPPPPPNVNAVAPDPDPNATTRERFRQHTAEPSCASCHALIDPLGFGFENFDQFGRFRTEENGLPVDASGQMAGFSEASLNGPFQSLEEVAYRVAASYTARDCLAKQWFRYAAGRAETAADLCSLGPIQTEFRASGDFRELLVDIATSDAFRYRAPYVVVGSAKQAPAGGTP